MAGAGNKVNGIIIEGSDDMAAIFKELAPKYSKNLIRTVNHAIAADLAKRIKQVTPKGDTGTLKKSIKAKRRKSPPEKPVSEVIFESQKGAKNNGFYWRFVEHGTASSGNNKGTPARPFVGPARDQFEPQVPTMIDELFKKKLVALIKREQKKKAKKT